MLAAVLTVLGLLDTESVHPLGRDSFPLGIAVAASAAAYLYAVLSGSAQDDDQQDSGRARRASASGPRPYTSSIVRRTL